MSQVTDIHWYIEIRSRTLEQYVSLYDSGIEFCYGYIKIIGEWESKKTTEFVDLCGKNINVVILKHVRHRLSLININVDANQRLVLTLAIIVEIPVNIRDIVNIRVQS